MVLLSGLWNFGGGIFFDMEISTLWFHTSIIHIQYCHLTSASSSLAMLAGLVLRPAAVAGVRQLKA